MRSSRWGRLLLRAYGRMPGGSRLLRMVVRLEGGEFRSETLREVLRRHHGVEVGPHSYGSLLTPGRADAGLSIGAYVSIGPGVRRFGANHPVESIVMHPYAYQPSLGYAPPGSDVERATCSIGDDAWIGADTIILQGCRSIGRGAVVGAGSVVTGDVPAFGVVAGNPAKLIRFRLSQEERDEIATWRFNEMAPDVLVKRIEERRPQRLDQA